MGRAQQQIFTQRAVKQSGVLRQQRHITAHIGGINMGQRGIVQQDLASLGFQQARQCLQQRGFACTIAAQDGNPLARRDIQLLDAQRRVFAIIAELSTTQFIAALHHRTVNATAIIGMVDWQLHQLIQPFAGHLGLLPAIENAGNAGQRCQHAAGQNGRSHQYTGTHLT